MGASLTTNQYTMAKKLSYSEQVEKDMVEKTAEEIKETILKYCEEVPFDTGIELRMDKEMLDELCERLSRQTLYL
jgi:glycyl-tRNA synthetase beta subunit